MFIFKEGDIDLNKYTNSKIEISSASELHSRLNEYSGSEIRNQIALLFDYNTFVETSVFTQRGFSDVFSTEKSNEFEGVITGYGAIDGRLVFVFAQDASRMNGAIDDRHAKKITDLYKLAMSNGAPVIGIFNSNGVDIFEGTAGLAAYGKIIKAVSLASGNIPQIAFVSGKCIGTSAAIAAMFDFIVKDSSAELYVTSPALTGADNAQDAMIAYTGELGDCTGYIKRLLTLLPDNSSSGIISGNASDNTDRLLGDIDLGGSAQTSISVVADNGVFTEIGAEYGKSASTAFATIAGVNCGIVANSFNENSGRIDAFTARKIARFVNFCSAFSIPVVTLVDSYGLAIDKDNENIFAPELAKMAMAYATSDVPMVTAIVGHAVGAGFILLGSKSLGADIVYALDETEIGALSADSGVAFAFDKYITEDKTREDFVSEWKLDISSPYKAAASGEIDDIINVSELRKRICSSLYMLCIKGNYLKNSRKVLPL